MIRDRLRNFLPVIIDVETGGFNEVNDALLEIAAIIIEMNHRGQFSHGKSFFCPVQPFDGAKLDQAALKINKIDPFNPNRNALPESEALQQLFNLINIELNNHHCTLAILVGHNAFFDLKFLNAAAKRCNLDSPFHSFCSLDTVTLGALAYGQTVLSKIATAANIPWDSNKAHRADYDAKITANIFCNVFNRWESLDNKPC